MEGEKPALAKIPITKKHYSAMAHKINTDKLRDMLREVNFSFSTVEPYKWIVSKEILMTELIHYRNARFVLKNCVTKNLMFHVNLWKVKR